MIMLAVVIPYYKINYFETTLQSLANQTDKRFTVYIGDDCSPEGPNEILKKYEGQFQFVYKRFDSNLGGISLPKQWQRCLDLVREEEWILLLGDDDVLGENVVAAFYQSLDTIQQNNYNVVRFATQKIDKDTRSFSEVYKHPEVEKSTTFLARLYSGGSRSSLSEYIFNKQKLFKIGIANFSLGWHSDVTLVLRLSDFREVYTINGALVMVRISEESISGSVQYQKEKRKADAQFGVFLVHHLNRFEKSERELLIARMEIKYLNNMKAFRFGFAIFSYYLINFKFGDALSLCRKVLKKI
ncbi:glycosyltransferase family 2 protein [Flavobacterium sp. XGLA_31]|uniref:glycosyltransferase family 2 protein n=1 Tax=Flavobacterium sp. XGLA_31 TaxID=3447666 RepID=UPI003F2C6B32